MTLGLFKKTKKLEKLVLICLRNTYSRVFDLNLQELVFDSNSDIDLSIIGELKSIALQAKQYLHYSLLVCIDHVRVFVPKKFVIQLMLLPINWNVLKRRVQFNVVIFRLSLLDQHDVFNCWNDIELHYVFPEASWLYLSVIKKVLNDESQNVSRRLLNFLSWFKLFHEYIMLW